MGLWFWPDVKAYDDGVGGGGEHRVALAYAADRRVYDLYLHGVGGELPDGVLHRLYGAVHVALYDDVELVDLALVYPVVEVSEAHLGAYEAVLLYELLLPHGGYLAGGGLVLDHHEGVTGLGHAGEAADH